MVILRSQNKIIDFFMILAWASPFNSLNMPILNKPLGSKGVERVVGQGLWVEGVEGVV